MPNSRAKLTPLLITVLVSAIAAGVIGADLAAPLQRLASDACLRIGAAKPPQLLGKIPGVVIVALDAQSLRAIPDWPWPRRLYAKALRNLDRAGAKGVAFDIDFSTPRDAAADAAFAAAVRRSGRVVLASYSQTQRITEGLEAEVVSQPIPALAEAAAGIGSVLVPLDADGVVRRAPRASSIGHRERPLLAGALLDVALGESNPPPVVSSFPLDYRRSQPPIRTLSMVDVIEGRFDPRDVGGRVVLIGATAVEFQDLWSTPLGPARPGVWIQAIAYRTLAAERANAHVLTPVSRRAQIALAVIVAIGAAAFGTRSHGRRLAGLAFLALALGAAALFLLVQFGILIDLVVPSCVLGAQYVLGLEGVRRRFGRSLAEREQSLATLFHVGETTAIPSGRDALGVGLALLGDVVDASGVALLRASPDGKLDAGRVDWRRRQEGVVGDPEVAAEVLAAGSARVFQGNGPGVRAGEIAVYTPLFAGGAPVGVLVVERNGSASLDATQLRTIATVGTQLALSVENLRLIDGLRATFDSSIEAIASAVEARDGYTESHCRRLALFSTSMAARLGLDDEEIEAIRVGALLHDVGKIGVRDEILLKAGRFSPEERAEMQTHASIGHRISAAIHGLSPMTLACVRNHHEYWDGTGYPDRLRGEEIPLGARIVAVVDVWDALSTRSPYKPAFPQDRVRKLLLKGSGNQFEPALVDLFLHILDEEGEDMLALVNDGSETEA